MGSFKKVLFRIFFKNRKSVVMLLVLQAFFAIWIMTLSKPQFVTYAITLLSMFTVVCVVNRGDKGAYKIAWIILMLVLPLFGGLLYLILTWQTRSGAFRKRVIESEIHAKSYLPLYPEMTERFAKDHPEHISQVKYLTEYTGFPLYADSRTEYYPSGEEFFVALVAELNKAEHFIFLEYFIIDERDRFWLDIYKILCRKAAEGVDVRVMYDDMGCMGTLKEGFTNRLSDSGIRCIAFNPFRPLWSSLQNNRDHRKIAVIDGRVAFTGGVNIADEYINEKLKYGHWRDSAVSVMGDAVKSFTVIFLQLWNAASQTAEDFSPFLNYQREEHFADGYILPFTDTPVDGENICEHVYIQIINNAKRYVYIETPYFIVDDSVLSAVMLAAKSGVDVRIITPGIPDKKLVHTTTRSYYQSLIDAGARVYEYTPGFIHSKVVVSDDDTAVVGTANFDFRSLYLHYECCGLIFGSRCIKNIKEDFFSILPLCREITDRDADRNILVRLGQSLLRIIAPLLYWASLKTY